MDNENGPFTAEYLKNEIASFRQLLGQKTFWAKSQAQRQGALNALGVVYFRMDATPEQAEQMAMHYHSAIDEYLRRELLCVKHGIPIGK